MTSHIRLHVWGPRALFSRPEMKVERVSYDVITPSAARGILEAIHWKPQMVWRIQRLLVLNPIRFESLRRNEVGSQGLRRQDRRRHARGLDGRAGAACGRGPAAARRDRAQGRRLCHRGADRADREGPGRSGGIRAEASGDGPAARGKAASVSTIPISAPASSPATSTLLEGEPPPPHESLMGERDLGWMALDLDYAAGMAAALLPRP